MKHLIHIVKLTEVEWKVVQPLTSSVVLEKDALLMQEGSRDEDLYFLESGRLEILKGGQRIAQIEEGHWVGEIAALLEAKPRTASVRASERCTLIKISFKQIKSIAKEHPELYLKILTSMSNQMAGRLQTAGETTLESLQREFESSKTRIVMGQFLCYVLTALMSFFYLVKIIAAFHFQPKVTTLVSLPLILFLSLFLYLFMRKSGYTLSMFGVTTNHWKRSVVESVVFTIPVLLIIVLLKKVIVFYFPSLEGSQFWHVRELMSEDLGSLNWILLTFGYIVFAPIQELIARGWVQGSLMRFLEGKHKLFLSIFLSNLIFGGLHLQLSLEIAISVFCIGCFWGWLYSRQGTLIGVSLSHIILGIWGGVIVGYLQ